METETIHVTHCTKRKVETFGGILRADELYLGSNVLVVKDMMEGNSFMILSGKYGLISNNYQISSYDHLLKMHEVDGLKILSIYQVLKDKNIKHVIFHSVGVHKDKNLLPYHELMLKACEKANVELIFSILDIE